MSVTLGPSSLLAFRALHPLEHSSVTGNKLTSANRFINYKHSKHSPIFQIQQEQRLGSFLPQKPQVSLTSYLE